MDERELRFRETTLQFGVDHLRPARVMRDRTAQVGDHARLSSGKFRTAPRQPTSQGNIVLQPRHSSERIRIRSLTRRFCSRRSTATEATATQQTAAQQAASPAIASPMTVARPEVHSIQRSRAKRQEAGDRSHHDGHAALST